MFCASRVSTGPAQSPSGYLEFQLEVRFRYVWRTDMVRRSYGSGSVVLGVLRGYSGPTDLQSRGAARQASRLATDGFYGPISSPHPA